MTSGHPPREGASKKKFLTINCPTCGKPTVYNEVNSCRPFCSRNCQTGDLAAWASDEYRVPGAQLSSRHDDQEHDAEEFD